MRPWHASLCLPLTTPNPHPPAGLRGLSLLRHAGPSLTQPSCHPAHPCCGTAEPRHALDPARHCPDLNFPTVDSMPRHNCSTSGPTPLRCPATTSCHCRPESMAGILMLLPVGCLALLHRCKRSVAGEAKSASQCKWFDCIRGPACTADMTSKKGQEARRNMSTSKDRCKDKGVPLRSSALTARGSLQGFTPVGSGGC
jgi:hypothetical protein